MSKEPSPEKVLKTIEKSTPGSLQQMDGSVTVGADWYVPVAYPTKRRFRPPTEDEGQDEMEETEIPEVKKASKQLLEKPVENEGPVPLIPNLDGNARQIIASIRVHKRTPPGDGIKGDVPASTTVDFIARRWGDGIYDFEGMNEAQQVLRRNANVKISMGYNVGIEPVNGQKVLLPAASPDSGLAAQLLTKLDAESDRSHKYAEEALRTTQKLSTDYSSMVREDAKERGERDRQYHKTQSEQQSNFFQVMLMSMQQMHAQTMEQQRESFQQTIQMMQVSHQQTLAMNNPATLLTIFEKGLRMGADSSDVGSEESPLATVLGAGISGLREIKELAMLQKAQEPARLPNPSPAPAKERLASTNPDKKPAISREEMLEILKLKRIAESKGYNFGGLVQQAQAMVASAPTSEPIEDDETTESAETDISEVGGSDLD